MHITIGYWMQKDELIQMHAFLLQIKSYVEDGDNETKDVFTSYDTLNVAPHHVFKSKDLQKEAVFELCKGISRLFNKKK